jgi:RNA polymerase sigma-70 factor (ECF subfamily)
MSFDSTTDDNLCELLARGEETAWYVFHQRYTERLIRYARAVVKHDEIALDVVQAVMVGLVRNRSRLGTVRDLEAYLFSAVRRDLWRALKQERKEKAILVPFDRERGDDIDSLRISGSQSATNCVDDRDFLTVVLATLPNEQRTIIELRYYGALTFERIGTILDLPLGTVVSRFRSGLQQLRANLEDLA